MDSRIDKHRQRLLALRDELRREGSHKIEPVREDPVKKIDEDAAPLTEMSQVIASNRNRSRAVELGKIEAALRRLEEEPEDFGLCESCDEPIPPRRLELVPWVRLCIKCQAEQEDDSKPGARRHLTDYK